MCWKPCACAKSKRSQWFRREQQDSVRLRSTNHTHIRRENLCRRTCRAVFWSVRTWFSARPPCTWSDSWSSAASSAVNRCLRRSLHAPKHGHPAVGCQLDKPPQGSVHFLLEWRECGGPSRITHR